MLKILNEIIEVICNEWPTALVNSLLNPYGPGDLFLGNWEMTASISSLEKSTSIPDRSVVIGRSSDRLNNIPSNSVIPILCLKDSHIRSTFWLWLDYSSMIIYEGWDWISSMSCCSMGMKFFCPCISFFHPFYLSSLFPIWLLHSKESDQFVTKVISEIPFL